MPLGAKPDPNGAADGDGEEEEEEAAKALSEEGLRLRASLLEQRKELLPALCRAAGLPLGSPCSATLLTLLALALALLARCRAEPPPARLPSARDAHGAAQRHRRRHGHVVAHAHVAGDARRAPQAQ